MKDKLLFSIIIPIFNGENVIVRCLDSIYSQKVGIDCFEVICVDDSSTDKSITTVENYHFAGRKPNNLILIKHKENKKRGGACNTGVNIAKGKWIIYIDCDDYFLAKGLSLLNAKFLLYDHLDILVYNFSNPKSTRCINNLLTIEMSGNDFIQTQPVPWTSWCYAFKREFLEDNNIKYIENVFFEDCDYVITAILHANRIKFCDIPVLFYNVYEGQTSTINSVQKVEDLFKLTMRLKQNGLNLLDYNPESAHAVLNHQWHQYYSIIKRYLWRLSSKNIYKFLVKYKPYDMGRGWIRLIPKYPLLYVGIAFIMKPFLLIASKIYKRIKK